MNNHARLPKEFSDAAAEVARSWVSSSKSTPLTFVKTNGVLMALNGYHRPSVPGREAAKMLGMSYPTFRERYGDGTILRRGRDNKYPLGKVLEEKDRLETGRNPS